MFKKEEKKPNKKPLKKKQELEKKETSSLGEMLVAPVLFIVTVIISYLIYNFSK